jgi:glycerol uptake facilitator protein
LNHLSGFVGELFGTFILTLFGCGAVAVSVLFSAHVGLFQVAAIWGVGVTLAIYVTRQLSCAHLNPAVSLGMVLAGRMDRRKLPVYLLAQLIGGLLAGLILYAVFSESISSFEEAQSIVRGTSGSVKSAMMFGGYFPNPLAPVGIALVSLPLAFLVEMLGTFLLVTIIFLLTDDCNVGRPSSDIAPVFVGLTVMAIISVLAPLTQAGLNPARDFGPRLVSYFAGWGHVAIPGPRGGFFTVYILGPLVGGGLSALLFTKVFQPLMRPKYLKCDCGPEQGWPADQADAKAP